MKAFIFVLSFIFLAFAGVKAGEDLPETSKSLAPYYVVKNDKDKRLNKGQALFAIDPYNASLGTQIIEEIRYSINGMEHKAKADSTGKFYMLVKPGKYAFQFFYTDKYYEITTDSIQIQSGFCTEIRINFQNAQIRVVCLKPVIYLYPEKETNVTVKLDIDGDFLFTYPKYENGWSVIAYPDGSLLSGTKNYSYLFWDGPADISVAATKWNEGFVVSSNDLQLFLEEKLTLVGLSAGEIQDYITFWVPMMNKNEKNYIHFMFNEEYNQYARLDVVPKPDNLIRVYMLWCDASSLKNLRPAAQVLPSYQRSGFTLVEWGGAQMEHPERIFGL